MTILPRRIRLLFLAIPFASLAAAVPATRGAPSGEVPGELSGELPVSLGNDLFGRSGVIRTALATPGERVQLPLEWTGEQPQRLEYRWVPVLGTTGPAAAGHVPAADPVAAPDRPGVYELELTGDGATRRFDRHFRLVVTVPFERKREGYIGRYFIGSWPTEGTRRSDRYAPPSSFIEVTQENQDLQLSRHFKLREFVTKGQDDVWPKYVVVDPRLLDKLELVMTELNEIGVPARHMIVMSGFRTPQYNGRGLGQGRASLSRHQYGDAADVWIDNERNWYMSDLNGDGRRDTDDARVMLRAVDRVEARHPDLVGGAGIYRDNGAHGPFIHIDVRGTPARW